MFPSLSTAEKLQPNAKRLFIGAYGFEERSLGWANYQRGQDAVLTAAVVFRYKRPKGRNRIRELREVLTDLGAANLEDVDHDTRFLHNIEEIIHESLRKLLLEAEEVIIDVSAMTKLLILICLCNLRSFTGTVKIIYSEADHYAPTQDEYEKSKRDQGVIAKFPSRGFESIVRSRCLSSIRMQGQPVSLVAFTSFNEQLIRHMLGTMNPHRLLFINGQPPRTDFAWREHATQEIHSKLIDEYGTDNPRDESGLLIRAASTLDYKDTIDRIDEIYKAFGTRERIICAATGSKMQTVGLFFSKIRHPDIHVEYPTPDSYFVKGLSQKVRKIHQIEVPQFADFLKSVATD
jgi:hypothetical protein